MHEGRPSKMNRFPCVLVCDEKEELPGNDNGHSSTQIP